MLRCRAERCEVERSKEGRVEPKASWVLFPVVDDMSRLFNANPSPVKIAPKRSAAEQRYVSMHMMHVSYVSVHVRSCPILICL